MSPVTFDTYFLTTTTNASGAFQVLHGLPFEDIHGMVVAVENREKKAWQTIDLSNSVDNWFAWNPRFVTGAIQEPMFRNAPVQIILFVKHLRPIG